ncbi:uncharacterized protein LOC142656561 isoform X2 [Rhinoderma darwinii]|uniref:uncharacterized protein LOC142656561 isoform X2 n=1 Tax=Rhinoderma darwinii TaxID=43563 RepID=UPI003F665542
MEKVVGIFSRDGNSCYGFLCVALRNESSFKEVRSFTITNNAFQKLQDEVSRCDCAILYHTKNRGRLNITNVTDSLYDEELKELSETLGRRNVIVVADDLDDSSPEVKMKILQSQPLIEEMADHFFLLSNADKRSHDLLNEKLQKISSHFFRTVLRTNEEIRSVPMAVGPVQLIYKTMLGVMMVVGPVQLICNKTIQCIRMVFERD